MVGAVTEVMMVVMAAVVTVAAATMDGAVAGEVSSNCYYCAPFSTCHNTVIAQTIRLSVHHALACYVVIENA